MDFTVFLEQENSKHILQNTENNVLRDVANKRPWPLELGVLNSNQPFNKQSSSNFKHQRTGKCCFSTSYSVSVPFTVYEDDLDSFEKVNEKLIKKNFENQSTLLLKNNDKINETMKDIVPKIELNERKTLFDITNIVQPFQPSVKDIVQTNEKYNIQSIDEITHLSSTFSSISVNHDESLQNSLTVHHLTCDIYISELYNYLSEIEKLHRPKPGYIKKQPHITYNMRAILVDWLVQIVLAYKMQNETLYLAISFIDRFLSLISVVRIELQLLGIVALFIASKYVENRHLDVGKLLNLTYNTYTNMQLLKMELSVLKVLEFNMSNPTIIIFLTHIYVHCNVPLKVMYLAMYLGELSLLEPDPYLSFVPSMVACGAVLLAKLILDNDDIWPEEMSILTNYCLNDLIPVLKYLNQTYKGAAYTQQATIRLKFKSPRYYSVSEIEYKDLVMKKLFKN